MASGHAPHWAPLFALYRPRRRAIKLGNAYRLLARAAAFSSREGEWTSLATTIVPTAGEGVPGVAGIGVPHLVDIDCRGDRHPGQPDRRQGRAASRGLQHQGKYQLQYGRAHLSRSRTAILQRDPDQPVEGRTLVLFGTRSSKGWLAKIKIMRTSGQVRWNQGLQSYLRDR